MTEETETYADVDTAFSAREVPWMKMGKLVDEPVTAAEAAKLGGIDFTVSELPLYYATKANGAPPKFHKIEQRKAIVRDDTGDWISVVSRPYPVLQYGEAFDFMDQVSPHFVAAGALRGGKQAFMVVRAPDTVDLAPFGEDDPHRLFAILRTSHDCSRAIEVMIMPLRDRCMNQLTLRSFRSNIKHRWSITHTGDIKKKLRNAEDSMTRLGIYATAYVDNARQLADTKVTHEVAQQILKRVLPDRPKRDEVIETIITNWHGRTQTVGFDNTGWGLVNAVSEYFEWDRRGGSPESRFLAALQGQTHQAINRTASHLLTRKA